MLFQMIFATESLRADLTRVRLQAGMNAFVTGELFVARKTFAASGQVAHERSFASVDANVSFQLSVV